MALRLVLHPSAYLVEAAVRDPHDVKRVSHPKGVLEASVEACPVGGRQVGRHNPYSVTPWFRLLVEPPGQSLATVALDHVDDPSGVQVDQAGRVPGPGGPGRRKPLRLIDPQRPHFTDAVRRVDERLTVFAHRVHHRVPRHPQLPCHLGDRAGVRTDLQATLQPGAPGEHAPRRKKIRRLRPRRDRAQLLIAAEPSFAPHQPDRPAERRQIPIRDLHPLMRRRNDPAPATPDERRGRLNDNHKLRRLLGVEHPEAR